MIPGTNVSLGERTFLIPPMNFKALKKHKAFIMRTMKGITNPGEMGDEDFEVMFDLVFLSIKRNYPTITEDELSELLDMSNVQTAMESLMKVSGFEATETKPGE